MAHDDEGAGHSHDHTAGANAKMLGWALALTSTYLVAEVSAGSSSIAWRCCPTPLIC